jgi:hypothetical protein
MECLLSIDTEEAVVTTLHEALKQWGRSAPQEALQWL